MSYGQFLLIFLVLPLAVLTIAARGQLSRRLFFTLVGVSVIAVGYTGPWDNAIIVNGVWSYDPHKVAGVLIGHVPLEEYAFYILQVGLTGMLTAFLLYRADKT
jgi:lycopene cyclase domain-containing protein